MNNINFSGIARNFPDSNIPDGTCNEIINMRHWNNAWRPVGTKRTKFNNIQTYDEYHVHTVDDNKVFIGYDRISGVIHYAVDAFPSLASNSLNVGVFDNITLTSIGNVFTIDVFNAGYVDMNTFYALFQRSSNTYGTLFDLNLDPLKINFYPSTGVNYPMPAGVTVFFKHEIGPIVMYIGINTITGYLQSWQYSIINQVATIINISNIAPSANFISLSFDAREDYNDVISVIYLSGVLPKYMYFKLNHVTLKYSTYANGSNSTLTVFTKYKFNEITFHAEGVADNHNLALAAAVNKATEKAKEAGQFEGFTLVCYALQMFDGTYIKHSCPELVYVGNRKPVINYFNDGNYNLYPYEFGNILYSIGNSEQSIIDKLKTMKDVIKAVDIFITKPITLLDITSAFATNPSGGGDQAILKDTTPYASLNYKSIVEQSVFYKIHSIPVEKLAPVTNMSTQTSTPTNISLNASGIDYTALINKDYKQSLNDLNNISSFTYLTLDNFSHHTKQGRANWVYNKRVLKGNTTTKLFKGFGLSYILNDRTTVGAFVIRLEVELSTQEGTNIVRSEPYFTNSTVLTLPDLLSYPDSRAKIMRILIRDGSGFRVFKTLNLTSHPFLNIAYYINPNNLKDVLHFSDDISFQGNTPIVNTYIPQFNTMPLSTSVVNDLLFNSNEVQASEVNNPFLFPAKNSYQVGDGYIIGMTSNSLPISAGQYGQHPIFVATTKGWWALNIQGGEIFIGSITPLNGSVCNNPKSITHIDGTVLFSSDEGLMILQGSQVANISSQLWANPNLSLSQEANYSLFTDNPHLVELNCFSQEDFRTHLQDAEICFDNHYREIIVSNKDYPYSYIYAIDTKVWTKVSEVYINLIHDYPSVYSVYTAPTQNIHSLIQLNREDTSNYKPFVVSTQPMKMGTLGFKKLDRLLLRCNINQNPSKYFGIYLFASQDGREWQFIDGKQATGKFNDMILQRSMTFKEAIILISGEADSDSYLTGLEYSAVVKLGNKLR